MARRKKYQQIVLTQEQIRAEAVRIISEQQQRRDAVESIKIRAYQRRETAHMELAARILRYKFSFVPAKTYEQLSEDLGVLAPNHINLVVLRHKMLGARNFNNVSNALSALEADLGLQPMPQTLLDD